MDVGLYIPAPTACMPGHIELLRLLPYVFPARTHTLVPLHAHRQMCAQPLTHTNATLHLCRQPSQSCPLRPPPPPLQDIPEFPPEVKPVVLTPGAAARYPCPLPGCDATLKSRFCLRRHWRSHTGEKPFACDVPGCGRSYGHKQSLQYVLRGHVSLSTVRIVVCGGGAVGR